MKRRKINKNTRANTSAGKLAAYAQTICLSLCETEDDPSCRNSFIAIGGVIYLLTHAAPPAFKIKAVELAGNEHLTDEELKKLSGLREMRVS